VLIDPSDVQANMARLEARGSRAELLGERLRGMVGFLTKEPTYYLHFGPYWWVFKYLVRRNIGGECVVRWAGEADDVDLRQRYATGNDWYDLNACLLYQADHSGNQVDAPQRHQVVDDSGEDTVTYELYDPDMHRG
jgi:hypothetical protein